MFFYIFASDMDNVRLSGSLEAAIEKYDKAVALRRNACFGEAVNAFSEASAIAGAAIGAIRESGCNADEDMIKALLDVCSRAEASIGLIREITGFVNTDLMNP